MNKQTITEKPVQVNVFPDPVKYLTVMIANIAIETDKSTRLDMAYIMLDACKEIVSKSELEVTKTNL